MFIASRRLNKLLACFLAVILLISNLVALIPVYAATGGDAYGQNENTDDLTPKQKTVQLLNQIIPHSIENGKQQGPDWLKTTDINLTFAEDFKPLYSLETFQPFSEGLVDGRLSFWQGRYAHRSGADNTLNLGAGLRWLSEDKTTIKGINAFYDYGFKYDLSRLGIGGEYFKNRGEFRFNFYIPLSDDRLIGTTPQADGILYSYIRAVNGFDFELGTSLANAPWLNLYASGFQYDNKHKADENGYKLRTKMQITPKFSMEMGYSNSNLTSGDFYGKILFQLNDAAGSALYGGNSEATSRDISYKLLQKVERENDIKTETWTQLVAYTGEIHVTVTTDSGSPLQGALVQAYQNGKPAGTAATTGADGKAILKGLSTGEYIVRAEYFSVNGNSPAVTVQKDQPADTAISLTITGGNANVHVIDSTGANVSGATVTAEATGGTQGNRFFMAKTASLAAFTVTAVTGADGIARFNHLPVGNYRFTATHSGKEMKSLAVNVTNGATSHGTVVLPASGGNIVAVICDANSQATISGATVVLKNGAIVIEQKTTGNDGSAVFSGLAAGITYTLTASAANYDENSTNIQVTDKETVAAEIALTPQSGGVAITVTDGTNPLKDATVRLTGNGEDRTATTDETGEAFFANVPTGTYTVEASRDGYHANTTSVTVVSGQTASVTVDITRQTGSITLKVTNGTNPLSVVIVLLTGNGVNRSSVTNNSGEVSFTNIPTGTYTVEVSKESYETVSQEVTVVSNQTETVTIALTQITTETIRVTDGINRLSGVTVSVTVNGQVITKTTNSQGAAIFKLPSYNRYTFTFTKEGYHTKTITVWVNGGTELFTESLTRQTGNATITVTDGTNPLKGATVRLTGNGEDRTATTNDSGEAFFTNVPTGTYTVEASLGSYNNNTANITVVSEQTAEATVTLGRQKGHVTITVTDGTNPLKGSTVRLTGNGEDQTATTNDSGEASFTNVPTGSYTVQASLAGYKVSSVNITVENGKTATATVNIIRPTGSVTFRVTDKSHTVIHSDATVSVTVDGTRLEKTTDYNGQVTFTALLPGTYTFTISKPWYRDETATVTVVADQEATEIIVLIQLANLNITVFDLSGNPLSGATVRVTGNDQDITVQTNEQGVAAFTQIPAGDYMYTISKEGYTSYTRNSISIIGTTGASAYLTRETGHITLKVTDGTNPLSGVIVRLTGNGEDRNATTDDFGDVFFSNIPTGTYTLAASMNNYETGSQTVTVVHQQTETATIALAREMITVQINILSDTGTKLSFASVSVTGNGINDTKETSWNGGVTFTLPAGTYTLTATHTYYRTISQELVVSRENNTFDLTTTRKVADIVFVVLDSDGHPLSGAVISKSYSDPTEILGYTDGTGRFELKNQPAGNYTFDVTKEFYNGWTSVVTVNQDGVIEKTFTLTRQTGNVRITVKNSSEAGIAGATVTLSDGSVHIANSIGIVKMDNVPAGEMSFTVSAPGYISQSVTKTVYRTYSSSEYNEFEVTLQSE